MRKLHLLAAASALAVGLSTQSASALEFDFTNNTPWASANGLPSFSAQGLDITASGGTLTFNAGDNAGCMDANTNLLVGLTCDGDGLGINDDEVDSDPELLTIIFSFASIQDLVNVELLDLFKDEGVPTGDETAEISVNGAGFTSFSAVQNPGENGGYLSTGLTFANLQSLAFRGSNDPFSDFSVARITTEAPEPATVALLGAGLIGAGFLARRRRVL